MKIQSVLVGAALVISTAAVTTQVVSQQGEPDRQPTPEEAEMMEKWMEFMTPNEKHARLNFKVGKWNGTVKLWFSPDQAEPTQSTATAEYKWIMGDRYLVDETQGEFMGQPFLGKAISGYDNMKKSYIWMWIDNMGTGFMIAEGKYDPDTETFSYTFEVPDVRSGKYERGRSTERVIDEDTWVSQMYARSPDGGEYKSMEITYKRAN